METRVREGSEKRINKKLALRLVSSFLLAVLAAGWSIPYALAERGYFAIGGEYLLIMEAGTLPWILGELRSSFIESPFHMNS